MPTGLCARLVSGAQAYSAKAPNPFWQSRRSTIARSQSLPDAACSRTRTSSALGRVHALTRPHPARASRNAWGRRFWSRVRIEAEARRNAAISRAVDSGTRIFSVRVRVNSSRTVLEGGRAQPRSCGGHQHRVLESRAPPRARSCRARPSHPRQIKSTHRHVTPAGHSSVLPARRCRNRHPRPRPGWNVRRKTTTRGGQ